MRARVCVSVVEPLVYVCMCVCVYVYVCVCMCTQDIRIGDSKLSRIHTAANAYMLKTNMHLRHILNSRLDSPGPRIRLTPGHAQVLSGNMHIRKIQTGFLNIICVHVAWFHASMFFPIHAASLYAYTFCLSVYAAPLFAQVHD